MYKWGNTRGAVVDLSDTYSSQVFREFGIHPNVNSPYVLSQFPNRTSTREPSISMVDENAMQPCGSGVLAVGSKPR